MKVNFTNNNILLKNNNSAILKDCFCNNVSPTVETVNPAVSSNQPTNAYIGYNLIDKYMGFRKIEEISLPFIDNKAVSYQTINGDKYIILQKDGLTSFSTKVEIPDSSVTAHLTEHLLFDECSPQSYIKELNNLNIKFNANCNKNDTDFSFYGNLTKDDLKKLIQIQAQLFENRTFTQEEIDKDKKILSCEHATTYLEKSPKEKMIQNIIENITGHKETSEQSELNYDDVLSKLTIKDVEDFYNKYYKQQCKTTVIVSPFPPDEVMSEISKHINKKELKTQSVDVLLPDISINKTKEINLANNNSSFCVSVSFLIPNTSKANSNLISDFLTSYINNRKYLATPDDKEPCIFANTTKINNNLNNPVLFTVLTFCDPKKSEDIKKKILSIIQNLSNNTNLQKAFENYKLSQKDSLSQITEHNSVLAQYLLARSFFSNDTLLNCDSLNINDVKNYINRYLDINKAFIADTSTTTTKNVSFTGNNLYETLVYPNNLLLSLRTSDKDKRASYGIELQTKNNSVKSPVLSKLLTEMLSKETSDNGLNIRIKCNLQAFYIDTDCIAERTCEGIKSVNDLLYRFKITPEKFEQAKKFLISKNELYQVLMKKQIYQKMLYGINPNFQTYEEELNDLKKVTINDLQDFYNNFHSNSQAIASININKKFFEDNKNNIYNLIGNNGVVFKPFEKIDWGNTLKFTPLEKNQIIYKQSNKQTSLIQRAYRFPYSDNLDDFVAFYAVKELLNRKIFEAIRSQKQFSYKTCCHNLTNDTCKNMNVIEVFAETETNSENLQEVYKKILETIEKFKETPGTQSELDKIKNDLRLKTSPDISSRLKMENGLLQLDSPYKQTYFQAFETAINNLDIEKVKNAAKYILNANSVTQIYTTRNNFEKLRSILNGEIYEYL